MKRVFVYFCAALVSLATSASALENIYSCVSEATGKSRIFLVQKSETSFNVSTQMEGQYFAVCPEQKAHSVEAGLVCVYGQQGDAKKIATFYPYNFEAIVDFMILEGTNLDDQSTWGYKTTTACIRQ